MIADFGRLPKTELPSLTVDQRVTGANTKFTAVPLPMALVGAQLKLAGEQVHDCVWQCDHQVWHPSLCTEIRLLPPCALKERS